MSLQGAHQVQQDSKKLVSTIWLSYLVDCVKPVCCPNGCKGEIKEPGDAVSKLKGGLLSSKQGVNFCYNTGVGKVEKATAG